jgi:hypothetical protein
MEEIFYISLRFFIPVFWCIRSAAEFSTIFSCAPPNTAGAPSILNGFKAAAYV